MAFVTIPLILHRFENCPHQYFAEIYLFFEKVMLDIKTFLNATKAEILSRSNKTHSNHCECLPRSHFELSRVINMLLKV